MVREVTSVRDRYTLVTHPTFVLSSANLEFETHRAQRRPAHVTSLILLSLRCIVRRVTLPQTVNGSEWGWKQVKTQRAFGMLVMSLLTGFKVSQLLFCPLSLVLHSTLPLVSESLM